MTTIKLLAELPHGESQEVPAIAGTFSGPAIVCGSAPCLWDDLDKLKGMEADLVAVNAAGAFMREKPTHWVSLEAAFFQWWMPLRHDAVMTPAGLHIGTTIHTHSVYRCAGIRHVWPKLMVPPGHGGSGLAAVRVTLFLGYDPVILAGMPMDGSGHFYHPPRREEGADHTLFLDAFASVAKHEFKGRVRSMSGNTRDLLGAP